MSSNPEWKRDDARQAEIDKERFERLLNEDPRLAGAFNTRENAAISDSFGASVGALNRVIRGARQKREANAKYAAQNGVHRKTLDDTEYAIRVFPTTDAAQMDRPKYKMTLDIDVWAHGDIIRSNDVWFRVKGSGWIWSGEFRPEDRNVGTLTEIHLIIPDRKHPLSCLCDECLPTRNEVKLRQEQNFFVGKYEDERAARGPVKIPKGANLPPETEEQREALRKVERLRQAKMGYRVGPHPWFIGWRVLVDRHDGRRQEFWRPTKASAERAGHKALAFFVARRQRAFEAANPRLVTARDRWIIEPTQAEQSAKDQAEWDAQFHGKEEQ